MKHFMLALTTIGALAGSARADVAVDWAKGLVTANGVGIADRHAPNPAVARGTSRRGSGRGGEGDSSRRGSASCRSPAAARSPSTPTGEAKSRLDRAVAQAIAIAAEPQTDGAWTVTMAVPIEAIRQALDAGPRAVAKDGDKPPAVVIVDGVKAKPAIGWTVGGVKAATIWVPAKDLPAWAKDAPHVTSTARREARSPSPGITGNEATLYVIVSDLGSHDLV